MRKFNVSVNGKAYAVEVEETTEGGVAVAAPAAAESKPVAAPAAPAAVVPANGKAVNAPMPGLVKKLCFKDGDTVKEGDTVIILEAMKMDTPVAASAAGKITYATQPGINVETDAVLCTIA